MIDTSDITFNVVFVRGTVRILRPFVHSLRDRTTGVRFRLVSNGCTSEETGMLRDLCRQDERLSTLVLSRRATLSHGVALNELHRHETSAFFAFMDSDCFATADFSLQLASELNGVAAVFSGQPVWSTGLPHRLGEGFRRLCCPYDELADGQCAGATYFAVYDNAILSACRRETGVSFLDYHWRDVPRPVQRDLSVAEKQFASYDTGRLLNVVLGMRGHGCRSVRLPCLTHVGGISARAVGSLRRRVLSGLDALKARRVLRGIRDVLRARERVGLVESRQYAEVVERRTRVSDYLSAVLWSLEERGPATPEFQHPDGRLVATVARVESEIRDLHDAWRAAASLSSPGAPGTAS